MRGIFVSYRRDDAAANAQLISDRLVNHFSKEHVFLDVENIELGLDFVTVIENRLKDCDVMLVVIGKNWFNIKDEHGKSRLEDPNDFVRLEVTTALKRKNVRVIPVLVDDVEMPKQETVPADLLPLVTREALVLRHGRFDSDMEPLIKVLEKILGFKPALKDKQKTNNTDSQKEKKTSRFGMRTGFALAFIFFLVIGLLVEEENVPLTHPHTEQVSINGFGVNNQTPQNQVSKPTEIAHSSDNQKINTFDAHNISNTANITATNMNGTWVNDDGFRFQIQHSGNIINTNGFNPLTGEQVSTTSGTFNGRTYLYSWNSMSSFGNGTGTLSDDKQHMDLNSTDELTGGVFYTRIHREVFTQLTE